MDARRQPAVDLGRIRLVQAHGTRRRGRIRPAVPGGRLRADPSAASLFGRSWALLGCAGGGRRTGTDRCARHAPQFPAATAPLVCGLFADAILESRYDGQSALRHARYADAAGQGDRYDAADLRPDRLRATTRLFVRRAWDACAVDF